MLNYQRNLKPNARQLRKTMTDAEQLLWSALRRKQILSTQFYRQKHIGTYIVDFYAPKAKLIVELDGSQHAQVAHNKRDIARDAFLQGQGLRVLRFNNLQVLQETQCVLDVIFAAVEQGLANPP